jgi:hypothetical protein
MAQRDDCVGLLKAVTDAEENLRSDLDQYDKPTKRSLLTSLTKQGDDAQSRLGDIQQTLQGFAALQKQMDKNEKDKQCLRDLYLVDPQDDLKKIEMNKDTLLEGAYEWILHTAEWAAFTSWDSSSTAASSSLMWFEGHAGTGKTILLMGIIRQLSKQSAAYTGYG